MDARRSARNSLVLHKAQEGVKGGTLAGGPPFAGGPRRPQPVRVAVAQAIIRRRAGVEPRPYRGRRNAVRLAVTVTAGRRGRRPLQGGCGDVGPAVILRRAGVEPRPYEGTGGTL